MSFEPFLMGNMRNRMLQAYVTLVRGLTCFKLSYMEVIVFKIAPGGRRQNHIYLMALREKTCQLATCIFLQLNFVSDIILIFSHSNVNIIIYTKYIQLIYLHIPKQTK